MKKNIAIVINNISSDYSIEFIKAASDYFKDKDANLIITQVQLPEDYYGIFEYQYWAGLKLLESDCIDAIIIITPIFLSRISVEKLSKLLKPLKHKPIISVSVPLDIPNSYCVKVSLESIYKKIVHHLKNKHACKKMAFISANNTGSAEAFERFENFKQALKENKLPLYENLIFDGNFTAASAYNALKEKYRKKEDIDFDVVLCANDGMAFGTMLFFSELGLSVPEDIKVFGFDDVSDAKVSSLSTINQNIEGQAYQAAELALSIVEKKSPPKFVTVEPRIIYRSSCGCNHHDDFRMQLINSQNQKLKVSNIKDSVYYLFDSIQAQTTLDVLSDNFVNTMPKENFHMLSICLYDEAISVENANALELPKKITLKFVIDKENENKKYVDKISDKDRTISIRKNLLPSSLMQGNNNIFMLHPIFYAYNQFGYMMAKLASDDYVLDLIFLKAYSNLISQSYLYTKSLNQNLILESQNNVLFKTAHTDELTGLLNRRGFYENGQNTINNTIINNKKGFVLFGDMDQLKYINDTFGHDYGDLAIKAEADVLQSSFRDMDIIGRLSGDEFAIVVPGLPFNKIGDIKQKIENQAKVMVNKKKLPFEISISIGYVEFNSENSNLQLLLKDADKLLYQEKRKKHSQRNI